MQDFLKDESFINYCRQSNEQDIQYWKKFIADNPDKKELIEEAVQEYRLLFTALANADAEEQLQQLKKKIEGGEQAPVVVLSPRIRRLHFFRRFKYAIAATAGAAAVAMYLLWMQPKPLPLPEKKDNSVAYISKQGERKSFQLPDGTQVVMNAGSELQLNHNYGQTTRELFLTGEAFFEVQHNKQVPFIVHTATMDVKALGTAFNVKSYAGESKTETVLVRGLVEVTLKKDNNRKVVLHPDEKIAWTEHKTTSKPATVLHQVRKLDNGEVKELAWMQNSLSFFDEPFEEIAPQLNRWYNVHIQFGSEAVKKYHFTATFKKEKIEQVLEILKASKQFKYRIDEKNIVIY